MNGDLYMDVASMQLLPIYQKVNRDWLFLANLKVHTLLVAAGGQGWCSRWWWQHHHLPQA